jgi:flagellar motor switch protein FliN/FliY
MATASIHSSPSDLVRNAGTGADAEDAAEEALIPSPPSLGLAEGLVIDARAARLPVELDVAIPVRDFRVRDLLSMEPGQVIATQWGQGEDLPLSAGAAQLAWSEFEVVESRLAVRVTRLS